MPERLAAIVGRPNVGKSALFNRLAGRRIAIVHDMPGVTRDRIHATCKRGRAPFEVVDTGGIGGSVDLDFTAQVHSEADIAVETANVVLFVVDAQSGITPVDAELARKLRKSSKPLILVINKVDQQQHSVNAAEFDRLGFADTVLVSAEHDRGINDLVDSIEEKLPPYVEEDEAAKEEAAARRPMKIALVGRPNVGKSSLTNAILRDERTLVSSIAGTTRDAVDVPYQHGSKHYVLIDTAGIRHRSKVSHSVEVFSVMRSENSITRADLVCLVIDASAGVTAMDKKIAGLIQEANKPCVVAVNKWDLVQDQTKDKGKLKAFLDDVHAQLVAVSYAPFVFCSAADRVDITRLFKTFEKVRSVGLRHLGTGVLNRIIQSAMTANPAPSKSGKRFKVLYATQPEREGRGLLSPVEIVVFCNDGKLVGDSYRRYMENRIREVEPFEGLPILFRFRSREEKPGGGRGGGKPGGGRRKGRTRD
jgi:GTP-binding protein